MPGDLGRALGQVLAARGGSQQESRCLFWPSLDSEPRPCSPRAAGTWPLPVSADFVGQKGSAPSKVQKRPWICRNWWLWAVFPCRAVPPARPEQDLGAESPKQSPWVWGAATQPLLPSHIIGVNIGVLGHGRVSWGWGKEHELRKETLGL